MAKKNNYINALQKSKKETAAYYKKSLVKTEQQKFLEKLLKESGQKISSIADIACGGGTLAHHLRAMYPHAEFTLSDFNDDALRIAKKLNGNKCNYVKADIYDLKKIKNNSFDLVCCWQTLSWLDEPGKAVKELLRITKPGGKIFASSLFNRRHNVDIWAKIHDHTRPEGKEGMMYSYNTYCVETVNEWIGESANYFILHDFVPEIDFKFNGKGIGTFTVNSEKGRLQISAGYLMNWAILEIQKK
ncbi:MAG: class I SAM-dependent methyltransferase [Bacteroidetes bacterium]|nr:class I SAM-dependent methyltransferase [Bacteroidota bacterium]